RPPFSRDNMIAASLRGSADSRGRHPNNLRAIRAGLMRWGRHTTNTVTTGPRRSASLRLLSIDAWRRHRRQAASQFLQYRVSAVCEPLAHGCTAPLKGSLGGEFAQQRNLKLNARLNENRITHRKPSSRCGVVFWFKQRAQLARWTETAVRQPWRNPVSAAIDDPAGDDIPRRSALALGASDAALTLPRHQLPTAAARARTRIVLARNEAAAVKRDHIAALVFGAGLIGTFHAHRQGLIDRSLHFIAKIT